MSRAGACGAGASIKPRVERGFASGTPGRDFTHIISARECGRQRGATPAARYAGSQCFLQLILGVSLAKPRFTPGYMLIRASRVVQCLRERLGLAVDEVVHHYDVVFLVIVWTRC